MQAERKPQLTPSSPSPFIITVVYMCLVRHREAAKQALLWQYSSCITASAAECIYRWYNHRHHRVILLYHMGMFEHVSYDTFTTLLKLSQIELFKISGKHLPQIFVGGPTNKLFFFFIWYTSPILCTQWKGSEGHRKTCATVVDAELRSF